MTDQATSRRTLLQTIGCGTLGLTAGCLSDATASPINGVQAGEISVTGTSTHLGGTPKRQSFRSEGFTERPTTYWQFEAPGRFESTAAIEDGVVYIGNEDGNLYAIDAETGVKQWSHSTELDIRSSPAVVDGTVFVGSMDGTLFALNATTGELEWTYTIPEGIFASPAVSEGSVYISGLNGTIYSLRTSGGSLRWRVQTPAPVFCSPAVSDKRVFVASYDRLLYAIRRTEGTVAWEASTDDFVYTVPVLKDDTVYTGRDGVTAFDTRSGDRLWKTPGHRLGAFPSCGNSHVITAGSTVRALNPTDGIPLWEFDEDGAFYIRIAIAGETVYALDDDGGLHAIALGTGQRRWRVSFDALLQTFAVVDNALFIGAGDKLKSLFGVGISSG